MRRYSGHGKSLLLILLALVLLAGCAQPKVRPSYSKDDDLHEVLSRVITKNGYTHVVRGRRSEQKVIDTVVVHLPLVALKRQVVSLHAMLFEVARLCARPEYRHIAITLELNAVDAEDRAYLHGLVRPIVAEAPNVRVEMNDHEINDNDVVITTVFDPRKP